MTRFLPYSERPELPSRAETWAILLGALPASILLVCAFRLAAFARIPLADDENAYRSPTPVIGAAPAREPARKIVVRPEPPPVAARRRHHRPPAARLSQPVVTLAALVTAAPQP